MKAWMGKLLNFKILYLMYFAGFIFVYLLLDLVWWKHGALSTLTCWQMLLAALLLAVTHFVLFECGVPTEGTLKKRITLHLCINYVLLLALLFLFGWLSRFTMGTLLLYTALFAVAYAGLCFAFSIYYSMERTKMNGRLALWKQNSAQ